MSVPSTFRFSTRVGGVAIAALVVVVVIAAACWFGFEQYQQKKVKRGLDDLIVQPVTRGPFDHIVIEQGEIESSRNTDVACEVKARGTEGVSILWVVDEGTRVKKGDKLAELDASQLELDLKEDRIQVITAEAALTTAEALLEQATISRQEYLEGTFMTEEAAIQSEIAIAEQELRKAQLALESSERLVAKGLVKSLQLEADRFALANARNQLQAAQGRLRVLQTLTKRKMLVQFDSEIDAAKANLSAARSSLSEEQRDLKSTETQIGKCILYAPTDGIVVHANRYSNRGGNSEFVVEAGAKVREQQVVIRLPDPTQMQVKCKVNESRVTLIRPGMPAKIRIDALPDADLRGVVTKVNRYAEPGSWFSSSVKEYAMLVEIYAPPEMIRTGMTAAVEIFVEQLPDATQVSIQAIYEHDSQMFALVRGGNNRFETRRISIGSTNDTTANVTKGLTAGETVVLNLRDHLTLMDLPDVRPIDNSEMRDFGKEPDLGKEPKGTKDVDAVRVKETATAAGSEDSDKSEAL